MILFFTLPTQASDLSIFRLHLSREPSNLNHLQQKTTTSSWLLGNLYRNLLVYDDQLGLVSDLADSCKKTSKKVIECRLKKNLKWSDGSDLTAEDFLRTYKKILSPEEKSPRADLLFDVKNAQEIYLGQKKPLGITAPNALTLRFELNSADSEFIYNLSSLALAPSATKENVFSGPYKMKAWLKGSKISLEANAFYPNGAKDRPLVEFLFISEDSVALKLYEKKELQLLRRLPTLFIPGFKTRPDFHFIPVTRFDYFGFGPSLKDKTNLRKALSLSLNYPELQKIFSSPGTPGCSGLPREWFENENPCLKLDLPAAKESVNRLTSEEKKKNYSLLYSSLGLEDHKRATEWMQSQWAQIGIKVNPTSREHKIFLQELKTQTPDLFREGVAPDRPTCLAALENFTLRESKDYLQFQSQAFEKIVQSLRAAPDIKLKQKYCTQGVRYLLDNYILIPTGAYDISMLIDPQFTGWRFNRNGQLDLSQLSFSRKTR